MQMNHVFIKKQLVKHMHNINHNSKQMHKKDFADFMYYYFAVIVKNELCFK